MRAWRTWWSTGVVIVFALLGHDLFMALPQSTTLQLTAPVHHASNTAPDDLHLPHPSACGTTQSAIAGGGTQLQVFTAAAPCAAGEPWVLQAQRRGAAVWEAPSWPPGMRRALLQIYRV